ncbi:MAG: tRNA (cytidine(56)-2'-O)-methyltransferase [Candidatus Micrarchaeota archaeon]
MIQILRLSHRLPRDERISTHVCLVARAFGADSIVYSGQHDSSLEDSVRKICASWGGSFPITCEKNSIKHIKECKKSGFIIVHLTMYGMSLSEKLTEIKKAKKLLVVVGSEHVPGEIYELADFNIAITNQPHSEVAALAITLDRICVGKEFDGKIRIKPSEKGKEIVKC